ncbi:MULTISPECIES: flagellin N-terminal helical domain-containing protein [Phyllobacteriaceae]|uniref:Flagellin n=1 Tax=Ollibium composti TaxID=2675109 RepID=A0ABY2QAS3_9HYPH|nr:MULTISPECIES: flagellin [Mesorhizobium]QDC00544.1 flagellin [Mesorhizobium sp. 8]THF57879.1 flagellin [Mesorhizobium composti]
MSSINTNASALTALQSLNATNKALETTQSRISTGFRVSSASDNAAYWSIATTMRSDNKANSVLQDALGLGAGKIDTAYTAINSAIDVVDQIKEKVLLAKTSSTDDRAKIQSEITALQDQLKDNIGGASYAGSNLLKTDSSVAGTKLTVMTSYNRDSTGKVSTGTIDVTNDSTRLIDSRSTAASRTGILDKQFAVGAATATKSSILDLKVTGTGSAGTSTAFDNMLTGIETALKGMATGAATLGAAKARIDLQKDFVSKLSDSIDRGVGQLVDADMNKESTRLQALQVQQQLGIQALSIANSNTQQILSLFR